MGLTAKRKPEWYEAFIYKGDVDELKRWIQEVTLESPEQYIVQDFSKRWVCTTQEKYIYFDFDYYFLCDQNKRIFVYSKNIFEENFDLFVPFLDVVTEDD